MARRAARVAVIGAGPVGLATALALRRRGLRDVTVYERSVKLEPLGPRGAGRGAEAQRGRWRAAPLGGRAAERPGRGPELRAAHAALEEPGHGRPGALEVGPTQSDGREASGGLISWAQDSFKAFVGSVRRPDGEPASCTAAWIAWRKRTVGCRGHERCPAGGDCGSLAGRVYTAGSGVERGAAER